MDPEHERIAEMGNDGGDAPWRQWGPYLSERQWSTVREDYSADGTAWEYLPHDHARSRAYRWGEDGIAGISDIHQDLCFALALWNGQDPILKERLFGLTGNEGNHGEDVKEQYFYLDNLPSHAYMKMLYKYPHAAFPYANLVEENRRRSRFDPEYELLDTGIFKDDAYFDVTVEYAKADPEDILIQITVTNRGAARALHLLPTLWFRNVWSWVFEPKKPEIVLQRGSAQGSVARTSHPKSGTHFFCSEAESELLFTENETNNERLFGCSNASPWVKDGINDYIVAGRQDAVNRGGFGTKVAAHHRLDLAEGETKAVRLRLSRFDFAAPFDGFDDLVERRRREADEFYAAVNPHPVGDELRLIQRQAFAGMLWSKQFYRFVVAEWLNGDPTSPPPPVSRRHGRNREWEHVYADDVISMPDKWEYPWFAAWDLAFHVIPFAMIDPAFAKHQLILFTREWYMHPNGELPAYEWSLGDVNPPVHAWAALRVYQIEKKMYGTGDRSFLERIFQKLLLNFTWWVNRKDLDGNNVFQGGFLGLDNIGVFDRSAALPTGGHINQSDGTAWMAVYTLNMLAIALELAQENGVYEDIASKFFEHFLYIANAMNNLAGDGGGLWDEEDGFYYDVLKLEGGSAIPLRLKSLVGLLPLLAVAIGQTGMALRLPEFRKRLLWFVENSKELTANVATLEEEGQDGSRLLAVVGPERIGKILTRMLDETQFLSPHGIRSISKTHEKQPFVLRVGGATYSVGYEPAESTTGTFGGNSNWRGPIWFPANYILIEALQKFHRYFGDDFKVEYPTGSGTMLTLWEVSMELGHCLIALFERDATGLRPVDGGIEQLRDPHWRDLPAFYDYFHGDTGAGLGASHQTGWTALVAKLIQQHGEYCSAGADPLDPTRKRMTTSLLADSAQEKV
jgi:hypothetical protein